MFAVVYPLVPTVRPLRASIGHGAIDRRGARELARVETGAPERLIETVWPEAYRVALTTRRDHGLAEDAAQDACATIARSLGALRTTICLRPGRTGSPPTRPLRWAPPSPDTIPRPGRRSWRLIDTAEAVDLDNALAELPVVQRAVIIL